MLAYLDVPTLNQPEAFLHFREGLINEAGEVTDEKTRDFLQRWVNAYQDFVRAHVKNAR
jgi:chromate reductase